MQQLEERFSRYVAHRIPTARDVRTDSLARIHGGASRETFRLRLRYADGGQDHERRLILRRDPPSSLIETERSHEFRAYQAFHGSEVPVPEPLWLEQDPQWLERPFFVMEEVTGCDASLKGLSEGPAAAHRERIGRQKWSILGTIARSDPARIGLGRGRGEISPEQCWERELSHWEHVIDADALGPEPVTRAAIRWLRRNPPPPAQRISVVHGDYRSGNFLYDTEGTIRAILDWEMWHLGDPLEDLAWTLNPLWSWPNAALTGRLLPRDEALAIWERASGLRAAPEPLRWWEVFTNVKSLAIWISSAREYSDARSSDPTLALVGWMIHNVQERIALCMLGRSK
ncbi:MAG: phosphotransferase family protein [Deltaproteobacteria bacterium]|nr:phosphotransferase family protein [Deltaproteobacteria bacterium]